MSTPLPPIISKANAWPLLWGTVGYAAVAVVACIVSYVLMLKGKNPYHRYVSSSFPPYARSPIARSTCATTLPVF